MPALVGKWISPRFPVATAAPAVRLSRTDLRYRFQGVSPFYLSSAHAQVLLQSRRKIGASACRLTRTASGGSTLHNRLGWPPARPRISAAAGVGEVALGGDREELLLKETPGSHFYHEEGVPVWEELEVVKDGRGALPFRLTAMGVVDRYWEILRQDGFMLFLCFVATLVSVLTFSLSYPIVGQQVDVLSAVAPGVPLNKPLFFRTLAVSAAIYIAQGVGTYAQVSISSILGERFSVRLREQVYSCLLYQELAFFQRAESSVGDLVSRLGADVNVMQDSVIQLIGARGVRAFLELLSIGGIMVYLSPRLAAVMLLTLPGLTHLTRLVTTRNVFLGRRSQKATTEAATVANEVLFNIETVRAFGAEEREAARFSQKVDTAYEYAAKMARLAGLQDGIVRIVAQVSSILALAYGGWLATQGRSSPGITYTFLSYTFNLSTSLQSLASATGEIGRSTGSAERVFGLLELIKPPQSPWPALLKPSEVRGEIELQNVWFRYPSAQSGQWALRGASFRAKEGSVVALVGPSGSGKSTIAALLLRLYEPRHGKMLLDNTSLDRLDPHWLRNQVGLVSQEAALFSGSLRENIAYARQGATQQEIEEAARAANVHEFIEGLPEGYGTQVGERGVLLSGGQRQRLAIARALLKNPRVLILDEATSALDVESEALVAAALKGLMGGRTTLVIAHRLSTVRDADHIVVLDKGRVREEGSHEELAKRQGGLYSQMLQLAAGRTDPIETLFDLADEAAIMSASLTLDEDEVVEDKGVDGDWSVT